MPILLIENGEQAELTEKQRDHMRSLDLIYRCDEHEMSSAVYHVSTTVEPCTIDEAFERAGLA